jgi:hypothetical protein
MDNAAACDFTFYIQFDAGGFYMPGGSGCANHCNHIRLDRWQMVFPKRFLSLDQIKIIDAIGRGHASAGVGRNVHFTNTGTVLSLKTVAYVASLRKGMESRANSETSGSAPDSMFQEFDKLGISYCCLYNHVPQLASKNANAIFGGSQDSDDDLSTNVSQLLTKVRGPHPSGTGNSDARESSNLLERLELPSQENTDMAAYAQQHRTDYRLSNEQALMIACAWWVTPDEKRLFSMFPEVILTLTVRETRTKKTAHCSQFQFVMPEEIRL